MIERPVPPANLSLLGLVRHVAEVERSWFRRRLRGEQVERLYFREGESADACFEALDPATAQEDFECLRAEWAAARTAASGISLEQVVDVPPIGEVSLRWIYIHMIEEYARHNGHADLIRQRIDGATGV